MQKLSQNLLISPVGDQSLYHIWLRENRQYDTYLIYYGDDDRTASQMEKKVDYFTRMRGTKFNMIKSLYEGDTSFFDQYDYVFIPDDDLYITQVNRIFQMAAEYKLALCQPSIVGYYDVGITLHVPESTLRYTNFVEVMCPCFSRDALQKCLHTFDYTVSGWGIDVWWDKILGHPKDQQAILDDVIAVHTRRCRGGENYINNNLQNPHKDFDKVLREQNLNGRKVEYHRIYKDMYFQSPDDCFYPNIAPIENMCWQLRQKKWYI